MYQDINSYISKNELVESNFAEVKRSYSAGVYKSSLIILWTCIVLDILEKSKRLEDYNSKAKSKNKELEEIKAQISSSNEEDVKSGIKSMLNFENSILEFAKNDLKILSHRGFVELKRIKADRNDCAHPSFMGDNLFSPAQSLVRSHIDSAWVYLISNHTLNGDYLNGQIQIIVDPDKTRVWRGVKTFGYLFNEENISNWDDTTFEKSISLLAGKIMFGDESWEYKARCYEIMDHLYEILPSKILNTFRKLADKRGVDQKETILLQIGQCFGHWSGLWMDFFNADDTDIIQKFFDNIQDEDYFNVLMENNFGISKFNDSAPEGIRNSTDEKIENLSIGDLVAILNRTRVQEAYIPRFIQLIEKCPSYDEGNSLLRNSANLLNSCNVSQISRIVRACVSNAQIYESYKTPENIKLAYQKISGSNKEYIRRLVNFVAVKEEFGYADYSNFSI
ncbi:hypothetical protein [Rothia nasisuis]|uniref:hypothetical protein n=1 Tax=Rothia nasisuis TaxID=2109647 RepID=UPI001F3F02AB|nr:hypothetical protein [Rothia nasisuis]